MTHPGDRCVLRSQQIFNSLSSSSPSDYWASYHNNRFYHRVNPCPRHSSTTGFHTRVPYSNHHKINYWISYQSHHTIMSSPKWSLKQAQGRASIVNGDIYVSPNSQRQLTTIIPPSEPIRFVEKQSVATDFQEPRWWTPNTEWLGFVPRQEVPYVSAWFGPLAIILNQLLCKNQVEYSLPTAYGDKWLEIDLMLWETCEIIRDAYKLRYAVPFPPRRWHYHKTYSTWSIAMEHITNGRDWFAMWLRLLYWSMRKIPNGPDFAEGLTPPDWFRTIVMKRSNSIHDMNTYVDAI